MSELIEDDSIKVAVICLLNSEENNIDTVEAINAQDYEGGLTYFVATEDEEAYESIAGNKIRISNRCEPKASIYNSIKEYAEDFDVITFIEGGDTINPHYIAKMVERMSMPNNIYGDALCPFACTRRISIPNSKNEPFSYRKTKAVKVVIEFDRMNATVPRFMRGMWIRADIFLANEFNEKLAYEVEKDYLYRLCLQIGSMTYFGKVTYRYNACLPSDYFAFPEYFDRAYYYEYFDEFWIPFLEELREKYEVVPKFIQYQVLYELYNRMNANLNNRNKHIVSEEEAPEYIKSWTRILEYVDDEIVMNSYNQEFCPKNPHLMRTLLQIKHKDENLNFDYYFFNQKLYYGKGEYIENLISTHSVSIQFMECEEGVLHIDALMSDIYDLNKGEFIVELGGIPQEVIYTSRYAHVKIFGKSVYKSITFEVNLRLEDVAAQRIKFFYKSSHGKHQIPITFGNHHSKLSKRFKNCYWCFDCFDIKYMAMHNANSILIKKVGRLAVHRKEQKLKNEMFKRGFTDRKARAFWLLRCAYSFCAPFMNRKPIWLFIDKIYKGGDSSEYIYKYAEAQDDGIKKYYLIDKNSTDYKRLKKEGYKPLVRDSLKHRLVFLYADMIICSNSTVFEFNGYSLESSSYMRDLFNFHVACVQHGMSIQKIAIAQNRLRDNIRLYFCASPYELENLNKPIYDYAGRHVLKLTGVPRYDGLKDNSQKQILISPTWRMQAALSPKGNESNARTYNPKFKETDYYKIYNSLINDPRLIEAAKEYGYKLLYVLHPIVSPQLEDFDTNEYVSIVPSIGDFSYEKAFCESSLMVTDYSGIQFDFAYMRKPVVYLHHKDMPTHYEEGTYHYDTMAFGEICKENDELIDLLIDYMKNDCKMKSEYVRRVDDFFKYSDNNNCSRIYPIMLKYTTEHYQEREKALWISIPSMLNRFILEGTFFTHVFRTNKPKYKHKKFKKFITRLDKGVAGFARKTKYSHGKVDGNKVFLMTYDSNYICNPRYIADEIIKRGLPYKLIWGVPFKGRIKNELYPESISLVRRGTKAMFDEMATSKVWIDNALEFMLYDMPKKKSQYYINTWHGSMGIKKLSGDDVWLKRASRLNKVTNFCITNSKFEEDVFRTTFWQDTPFLKLGHARNDVFFDDKASSELRDRLITYYDLNADDKVFLYAPTFREAGMKGYEDIDYEALKNALDSRFGGNWIILVRWHHKERRLRNVPEGFDWLKDASEYGDMQELLPAIDAGMSDYSSWVYDYVLRKQPIFLYAPDVDEYDQARGFYYPLDTTPFPIVKNNKELIDAVERFDTSKYYADVDAFLEDKGCYEEGNAAKRIVDEIEKMMKS